MTGFFLSLHSQAAKFECRFFLVCEALDGSRLLISFKDSTNSHVQDETSHVTLLTIDNHKSTWI